MKGTVSNQPKDNVVIDKAAKKELQKVQKQIQLLEEQIAATTNKKSELEKLLASPETYSDKTKFLETEAAFKKATEELHNLQNEYDKVFEKLIALEQ